MNDLGRQSANGVTEALNHFIQRCKYLVAEALLSKLFPDPLNRIHFRCVWRNKEQHNAIRYTKRSCFVPGSSVAAQENNVIRILLRQLIQKDVHTLSIAIRHDKKA